MTNSRVFEIHRLPARFILLRFERIAMYRTPSETRRAFTYGCSFFSAFSDAGLSARLRCVKTISLYMPIENRATCLGGGTSVGAVKY